jgi:hypothetical protein
MEKHDQRVTRVNVHVCMLTTPVGSIVLLLDVPFKPAMGIGSVQEIDLTPFQRCLGSRCRVLCIRLHPTNVPREDDVVFQRPIATVITFAGRRRSHQRRDGGKRELPHDCVFDVRCAMIVTLTAARLYTWIHTYAPAARLFSAVEARTTTCKPRLTCGTHWQER